MIIIHIKKPYTFHEVNHINQISKSLVKKVCVLFLLLFFFLKKKLNYSFLFLLPFLKKNFVFQGKSYITFLNVFNVKLEIFIKNATRYMVIITLSVNLYFSYFSRVVAFTIFSFKKNNIFNVKKSFNVTLTYLFVLLDG